MLAADRWLTRNGLADEVDGSWLELVCEDGDVFRPDALMLHLAVPPCEVAPGESVDVGRAQTVAQLWPEAGAPPDEVPRHLALARTFERRDDGWVAASELPGPVRDLFTVEHPDEMLSVMTATRRTLNRGTLRISGDSDGRLTFTAVEGNIAAWGSTEAQVPEAFIYWLHSGPATALATPLRGATRAVGSLGPLNDLIITNQLGIDARCPLDDEQAAPDRLPEDWDARRWQRSRTYVRGTWLSRSLTTGVSSSAEARTMAPRSPSTGPALSRWMAAGTVPSSCPTWWRSPSTTAPRAGPSISRWTPNGAVSTAPI